LWGSSHGLIASMIALTQIPLDGAEQNVNISVIA
jgi:hypothetical protein